MKKVSDERKGPGPEPRFTQRILLPMEPATVLRVEAAAKAEKQNRAQFIRTAIDRELKRRERTPPPI